MLAAVRGIIKGNTVVIPDEDIREYQGAEVVVTFLTPPLTKNKKTIDLDSFVVPSERGNNVENYMREMRDEDRL